MKGCNKWHMVTGILLVIGGLNWLLVGLFGWDIGEIFGGQDAWLSKLIYILVGLSAVYELVMHKKLCKECEDMSKPTATPPSGMPV